MLLQKHAEKLSKPSHNCSKVKTVTDSQTKALFYSFYAWYQLKNETKVITSVIFTRDSSAGKYY